MTTSPLEPTALPLNLPFVVSDPRTERHSKYPDAGVKNPTQSASLGAKTMVSPFPYAEAPWNLPFRVIVLDMSIHWKALVLGLNVPTQSSFHGAKTTRPFDASAAY